MTTIHVKDTPTEEEYEEGIKLFEADIAIWRTCIIQCKDKKMMEEMMRLMFQQVDLLQEYKNQQ